MKARMTVTMSVGHLAGQESDADGKQHPQWNSRVRHQVKTY